MIKSHRYSLFSGWVLTFLYHFIRLYSWTFRIRVENESKWLSHLKGGGTVLLCGWHQQFFSAIRHFKSYSSFGPSLMISQSKDGDVIARVANLSGWHTVRGSSSRDGKKALREMTERLKKFRLAGHIVDGPRGPAGVVKPGLISLANAAEAMLVPFYTTADRAWYFKSWDRFMLPKPFAKVTLSFGQMIDCSANGGINFEVRRLQVETAMRPMLIS